MTDKVTVHKDNGEVITYQQVPLEVIGKVANEVAASHVFKDCQSRKAKQTLRRQAADLAVFADYLESAKGKAGDFMNDPEAWRGVTWGLVEGFQKWQLGQGYAIGTINLRLSRVKAYCKLAVKAGALERSEYAMIRLVSGYDRQEGKHINVKRIDADVATRKGYKKADPVPLTNGQPTTLKTHPDTPQGRRDALLMCLLLDHGLRVGEVVGLQVDDFDAAAGEMTFYRPKVDKVQIHILTADTLAVLLAYEQDAPESGPILRGGRKGDHLAGGMTDRAITRRVRHLGRKLLGIPNLSAHDCRHYWATKASRNGTPIEKLKEAGGWSSLAMPDRYIGASKVANEGVILSEG